ncbi:hypothetical protein [Yunchengibacter salinarum]|uniref:hypothetical protein n=1 Tax=Yunchengibacter salinarum TaxID=3133399 RepID=UPI0035B67FE8
MMRLPLIAAVWVLAGLSAAHGCSCVAESNPAAALRKLDLVAHVTVAASVYAPGQNLPWQNQSVILTVRPTGRPLKGTFDGPWDIRTIKGNGANCGLPKRHLAPGSTFLLGAVKRDGTLHTNLCLHGLAGTAARGLEH